jgi:hypothetical protein
MRDKFRLVFLVIICLPLFAPASQPVPDMVDAEMKQNQLALLDNLIAVTEKNVTLEKQLRQMVQEYLKVQEAYLQNPSNQEQTLKMVTMAQRLLDKVKEANLLQAFDTDFISELTFFSQIAAKRGLPSPE